MLHLRHRTVAWSRLVSPRSAEWSNEDNGFLASLSPCPAPPIIMHYSEPSSGENYFLHNKYSCRLFRFVMGEEENRMRGIIGFFVTMVLDTFAGIWRHSVKMKNADAAKYSLCAYLRGVVVALIQLGRASLKPRRLVLKVGGGTSTFQAGSSEFVFSNVVKKCKWL